MEKQKMPAVVTSRRMPPRQKVEPTYRVDRLREFGPVLRYGDAPAGDACRGEACDLGDAVVGVMLRSGFLPDHPRR